MAQTFSYKYLWHKPLPKGFSDEGVANGSMFCLSLTGPATSVQAGMTVASLATDLTYISNAWYTANGSTAYLQRFNLGTGDIVSDFKVIVQRVSTGLAISDAASLASHNFRIMGVGSGPFGSAID